MPKGTSVLETEVKKLRADMYTFQDASAQRITALEQIIVDLSLRLEALEGKTQPIAPQQSYKPLFDKWPSNGSA